MEHRPVSSSHVESIAHEGETLEVRFKNGAVYRYEGVGRATHDAIVGAKSVGSALHRHVISKQRGKLLHPAR